MVDPNRKINHLTDKDIEFLDECEDEFKYRFTEMDEEFKKYCSQPMSDPPVVPDWPENRNFNRNQHYNGRGSGGGGKWNNNQRRGGFRPYNHRKNYGRDNQPRRENWN